MAETTGYSEKRRSHFTFIWAIENAFDVFIETRFNSPIFTVKTMEMTEWHLVLDFSISSISMYLRRCVAEDGEEDGPDEIEIEYELSILDVNGLPIIKKADTQTFFAPQSSFYFTFANKHDVFSRRRADLLPQDVLTIRCRMWKKETEIPKPDVCFARTRICMDRHRFIWTIKDYSSFTLKHKMIRQLKSISEGAPDHNLIFCLREHNDRIYACIDFEWGSETEYLHINGEIALLDTYGGVKHSEKIIGFKHVQQPSSIIFFDAIMLLYDKTTRLHNNELNLRCSFDFFYGPLWCGIENDEHLKSSARVIKTYEESRISDIVSCPFRENVCRFFDDGTLSDVTLRADAEIFPVHKFILSSRSPVFKAMFTNDMREKASKCIDVSDVDAVTLRRLLLYIYKNEVPGVEWDKAADLLKAADKYELLELKKKCSDIIKSSLSQTNICYVLALADMHNEEDLRKAVFDFLTKNLDIFSSEAWKIFKKENSELAMETMERIIYITNSNQ